MLLLLARCASVGSTWGTTHEPTIVQVEGDPHLDFARNPRGDLVQLRARRFRLAPWIAVHQWFLVYDARLGRWESWELRRSRRQRDPRLRSGEELAYDSRNGHETVRTASVQVGCVRGRIGITRPGRATDHAVLAEWTGASARRLLTVLRDPRAYPGWDAYRLWPGRNSNAYVAWAAREADVPVDLHPMAVGKDFLGPWGFGAGLTTARTGLQLETPFLGAAVGLREGVELHLLQTTWGVDLWPPALKTPLGRFGVPE